MKRSRNWYKAGYDRICLAELLSSPPDSRPPEEGRGPTSLQRIFRMPYFVVTQPDRRPRHPHLYRITVACDPGKRYREASNHDGACTRRKVMLWRSSVGRLSSKNELKSSVL